MLQSYRLQRNVALAVVYLLLIGGLAVIMVPFAWMISTSLKTTQQALAFPPVWIPTPVMWENFVKAFTVRPFDVFYRNSLIVAAFNIVGQVISCSLVAYGFARLRFPGRDWIFLVVLSTTMIPFHVLLIPRFVMYKTFGWLNSLLPLIIPNFFAGAFFIFLLRQYFMTIPLELDDAAKIDGCGYFATFWRIILPLSKPALGAVMAFEFINAWEEFLGPLIYINSEKNYTVALGLAAFRNDFFVEWNLYMAAAAVAMAVPLFVFFLAQKYFIHGVALMGSGGLKQ